MNEPFKREASDISNLLKEHFGVADSGEPIFRIVWSEDQYEKRLSKYSLGGIELLQPEVQLRPKYKQWIHKKYVLERLVSVPAESVEQMAGAKTSYEPLHVFENKHGQPLPPKFEIAKFLIENMYAAMRQEHFGAKYVESTETPEVRDARLQNLQDELFGNETEVGDALAHKQAIVVPRNYDKSIH
jgi:hypothetical protein